LIALYRYTMIHVQQEIKGNYCREFLYNSEQTGYIETALWNLYKKLRIRNFYQSLVLLGHRPTCPHFITYPYVRNNFLNWSYGLPKPTRITCLLLWPVYLSVSLSISWHLRTLRYLTLSEYRLLFHSCYWQSTWRLQYKMLTQRLSFLHGLARENLIKRGLRPVIHSFLLPPLSVSVFYHSLLIIAHSGVRNFSLHPCEIWFKTR
jgi:hypothetical protein